MRFAELRRAARAIRSSIRLAAAATVRSRQLPLLWQDELNWGDALNPLLANLISGKKVYFSDDPAIQKYLMIGSVLWMADAQTRVWGAGFIQASDEPRSPPLSVHAVRGPLTQQRLNSLGIDAPQVYGDPAILLPRYYSPKVQRRFRLGIVPHYVDFEHPGVRSLSQHEDVTLIDIRCSNLSLVDRMLECDAILSSSLHGIICAHAYGIPNRRAVLSSKLIGGDFKFLDYFAGVNLNYDAGLDVSMIRSLDMVLSHVWTQRITSQGDRLLDSCPFAQ